MKLKTMLKTLFCCAGMAAPFLTACAATPGPHQFEAGDKAFLLDGKPFLVRAGELHYSRIPREYWNHRIKMTKALGMNTICIYLFWNYHEMEKDKFDFSGEKDIVEFVKLIQENGMYCILRPGPYSCAEWEMGGLPWWLLKKDDLKIRTFKDELFKEQTKEWLTEVGKRLAPYQIQNGGPIILVQVENEYACFGNDGSYMEGVRDTLREAGFDKVTLMRCDWGSNFNNYKVDGVVPCINFGAGSNVDNEFRNLKRQFPNNPLMCSEYWTGWFDHWGKPHETRGVETFIGSLKDMLDRNISFSLYMAHGGTTFGQWGGANAPPYSSMVASYDYNAPITEAGWTTDKFFAVRDLLKNYLNEGETLAEVPEAKPLIEIPAQNVGAGRPAPLFSGLGKAVESEEIKPMEEFDLGYGMILYRTTLPASASGQQLKLTELHDIAHFFPRRQQRPRELRRGDHRPQGHHEVRGSDRRGRQGDRPARLAGLPHSVRLRFHAKNRHKLQLLHSRQRGCSAPGRPVRESSHAVQDLHQTRCRRRHVPRHVEVRQGHGVGQRA